MSSSNAPGPEAPTVPTTIAASIPEPIKRKLDQVVTSFPKEGKKGRKRPKRSPNATRDTVERLSPNTFDAAYIQTTPSNTVAIPASELARQDAYVRAFDKMFSIVPDLLDVVKHLFLQVSESGDEHQWNSFTKMMSAATTSVRTSDTGGLKHCVHYVLPDPFKQALLPAIPKQDSKSDRGLAHPILRYFLLRWKDRLELPPLVIPTARTPTAPNNASNDEEDSSAPPSTPNVFFQRIVSGNVELKAADLPSFLWADGSYDPDNWDRGLLRGDLLLRTVRHIWTGPSSACTGLKDGIPAVCNARLHAKYTVDPEIIACAATQARTMLSTKDWKLRDGSFNNEEFYDAIIKLFSGLPDDPWAVETLDWYQRNVFGDADLPSDRADAEPTPNAADIILTQRAARQERSEYCKMLLPSLNNDPTHISLDDDDSAHDCNNFLICNNRFNPAVSNVNVPSCVYRRHRGLL
ncbi:hypothetical protein B0H19DRAFT_1263374 [Mycena capillaripes]|nr:hypothetical protein B0H19DRAFT_1263374 [Mycena capillaripes]